MRIVKINQKKCPECNFEGGVYDFSPSIAIDKEDFRIFHCYSGMRGTLYCNQCKRKHLLKIANKKNLTPQHKNFLQTEIRKFSIK